MRRTKPSRTYPLISRVLNVGLVLGMLCVPPALTHAQPGAESRTSLRQRALEPAATFASERPTGQCIYTCDDRPVTLKRCPDGECPEYDCKTGEASCRSR